MFNLDVILRFLISITSMCVLYIDIDQHHIGTYHISGGTQTSLLQVKREVKTLVAALDQYLQAYSWCMEPNLPKSQGYIEGVSAASK